MAATDYRERTDGELVELARGAAADPRPFEVLVGRYQQRILTNCRYLTRSPDDAEDLAQEVFVKAFFGLARFEGRSKFSTWLQSIKINHCLNFLQKKKGRQMVDLEAPGRELEAGLYSAANSAIDLESLDQRRRIGRVLDSMSATLRVPLLLRDLDGLSYQEVADRLGIGMSAVKMRIKRAREEFRELYGRDSPGRAEVR
ncbi:MAG: RNA polymerase sigma factor [Acidobacteriota bacterium]|nr:RNA polymerase sigma factor [Acidobacteriota bacterium]MDH3524925.1 RNA polymerase sigma factor [Acidobacteriota bacterium]